MRRPDWDELLGRGRLQRLPQLEPVAFRVDRVTEPPVALLGDLVLDRRTSRPQLREHRVQAGHPEVQHRLLVHATEVIGVGTERGERGHARLLLPRATGGDAGDAEVRLVPGGEGIRILRAEEVAADSEYALHAATLPSSWCAATETEYLTVGLTVVLARCSPRSPIRPAVPWSPTWPRTAAGPRASWPRRTRCRCPR